MWFEKSATSEKAERTVASIMLKKIWLVKEPSFWKRVKNENTGKWDLSENMGTVVKGEFKNIGLRNVWEWSDAFEVVEITLEDENGTYVVSGSRTSIMCNIINSLAGTAKQTKLKDLEIGMYESAGKDGKMYAKVWVKNNGKQAPWLHDIETQNKLVNYVEIKGNRIKDDSKYISLLKTSFDEINGGEPIENDEVFNEDLPF